MTEPPPAQGPYGGPPVPRPLSPQDEQTWAGAAHWSAFVAAFVALAFLGPLLVLMLKGNESAKVRAHAVESLNFQLSMLAYGVAAAILSLVTLGLALIVVLPLALAAAVFWFVATLLGALRASEGAFYRYPLSIRFVS